jgi:hypothetical protein
VAKTPSFVVKLLSDWKLLFSAIAATIPVLLFVFSQLQWKANLDAEQSLQNGHLTELKETVKQHEVDDAQLRTELQTTNNQINNKLSTLSSDVAEIKGQLQIIVPKLSDRTASTIPPHQITISSGN